MVENLEDAFGTRLLDAGCGSGWLSRLVAKRMPDCEVVGVDINPDYVAFANERAHEAGLPNLRYEVGAVGDLPFADESFDTVWSLMLLMFLPDRPAAGQTSSRRRPRSRSRPWAPGGRRPA